MRKIFFLLFCSFSVFADQIANQSHQALDKMPSIAEGEVGVYKIPIVRATKDSLKGYANIVYDADDEEILISQWPAPDWRGVVPETGRGGGTVEGIFSMERSGNYLFSKNHALDRFYLIGWYVDPGRADINQGTILSTHVYTHEANYHPDGGQLFFPLDQEPFIAVLAKPGDDVTPEDFVGFYCDGSFGIQILPYVWHQPMFPLSGQMRFFDKQGAVHACVPVDFVEEFGVYLEIPLMLEE